ncbi:MAG TPA: FkbM family methyltransferase [Pyrinomonadaceae bacterium]|jgi:FkbM family methyltransferase
MQTIKSLVKSIVPAQFRADAKKRLIKALLGHEIPGFSFSTGGEDAVLNFLFAFKNEGFYVDVGAFHPTVASNTYLFYLKGWRGINIDARPGSMSAFRSLRPEDINLEAAISDKSEELTYYVMKDSHSSINTFSEEHVRRLNLRETISKEIKMRPVALREVFKQHLAPGQEIDFLTIDVEGLELDVLSSNDWRRFRPKVIMLENFESLSSRLFESGIVRAMEAESYRPILKSTTELVLLDARFELTPTGQIALGGA